MHACVCTSACTYVTFDALAGKTEIARFLLERKADPNTTSAPIKGHPIWQAGLPVCVKIVLSDARAMHMIMSVLGAYGRGDSILQHLRACGREYHLVCTPRDSHMLQVRLDHRSRFSAVHPGNKNTRYQSKYTLKGGVTVGPLLTLSRSCLSPRGTREGGPDDCARRPPYSCQR